VLTAGARRYHQIVHAVRVVGQRWCVCGGEGCPALAHAPNVHQPPIVAPQPLRSSSAARRLWAPVPLGCVA
jgi:hypothetical protein